MYRSINNLFVIEKIVEQFIKDQINDFVVDNDINNIISKVNYILSVLKEVFKFARRRTKLILMNSFIISIFYYCCPLQVGSNCNMITKKETLLIKHTCCIYGYRAYKKSTISIMRELEILAIPHLIIKETIIF